MSVFRQPLVLLLVAAFITGECTAAEPKAVKNDVPRTPMTVRQAQKSLAECLNHLSPILSGIESVRDLKFTPLTVAFTAYGRRGGPPHDCSLNFAEMGNLSVAGSVVRSNRKPLFFKEGWSGPAFEEQRYAALFVDALLTLKEAALAPDTEEADFAAFTASAKIWLGAAPKSEMSDEARTFKVLAEDAFKRKDLPAALDAYGKALAKHPMWPEGHFNAALLAAETEDYELAARHMRRYLVLAPDAKDAPAAKDKLLLWQAKAKQ